MKICKELVLVVIVSIPMMSVALDPPSWQQQKDLEYVADLQSELTNKQMRLLKLKPWNIKEKSRLTREVMELRNLLDEMVSSGGLESYITYK